MGGLFLCMVVKFDVHAHGRLCGSGSKCVCVKCSVCGLSLYALVLKNILENKYDIERGGRKYSC